MELFLKLLFLCPMLFVAGVVDGISGGGGLIALPSYLISGIPISSAYACNKVQSCLGTSASMFKYARSGMIDWRSSIPAAIAAVIGSFVSTQIMLSLDDSVKKFIIGGGICFALLLSVLSSRLKVESNTCRRITVSIKSVLICLGVGLLLGLYDGFFGPGGGTIAIFLFALLMKYDLRVGSGNGKVIVVIANLTSTVTYIINGSVIYSIALPCAAANIAGSYIGASLATRRGAKFVKYISLGVVAALVVYAAVQAFK